MPDNRPTNPTPQSAGLILFLNLAAIFRCPVFDLENIRRCVYHKYYQLTTIFDVLRTWPTRLNTLLLHIMLLRCKYICCSVLWMLVLSAKVENESHCVLQVGCLNKTYEWVTVSLCVCVCVSGESSLRVSSGPYKSVQVDVTGKPRKTKVRLPKSILSSKPCSVPNLQVHRKTHGCKEICQL